ncbi:caspase-2-like [Mytilus californianus]|uniref:caspase-2-like n=1 Tax=Mytilus californianus TaxID=6549 RepID=UPI002245D787|nr:caspase-2-like [Mytilus californianus]XP_052081365.1 caspase-2-like [Mytilus californianus]
MDKIHRKALTQCRSKIVSDLSPDNEFWDKIAEKEIFTPLMLEYIQAKYPRPEKVRQLLDDLLRRGPDAYWKFLYCLDNSGHRHLADVIRQKEQLILNPNYNPIIQEARFTGNIRGTSTSFQPTAPNNQGDIQLPHSVSAQTINERNTAGQFPHSQSNPNITSSGTPVTSPSDESASSVTTSSSSTTSYPSTQLLSNTSVSGQNSSNNDISMENEHDGLTSQLPGTSSQYDNRQQTSSLESTPETSSHQATERTKKYKMESTPRGFVLIINNIHFRNHKHRPGAEQDRDKLKAMFEDFGFEVDVKEDQTAMQVEELLSQFSLLQDLYRVDSLIVVLMSHGNDEFILGSDCQRLNVINLIKKFNADYCPAMMGKPKMFIVNACRGDDVDCNPILGSTQPCYDKTETDSGPTSLDRKQPANSDLLIAYSTFPGYVSFRDEEQGSWFIQCLEEVFRESASDEHVMDMLTQVNDKVASKSESMMGYNQTPAPSTTLRYKWYLNPQTV